MMEPICWQDLSGDVRVNKPLLCNVSQTVLKGFKGPWETTEVE